MKFLGITSIYNATTGHPIATGAAFSIEAVNILEALKSMTETECDLLEHRNDQNQLRIVVEVQLEKEINDD